MTCLKRMSWILHWFQREGSEEEEESDSEDEISREEFIGSSPEL